jgi:hypothetical protein
MKNVPEHQQFIVKDGPALQNLKDLQSALATITNEQFSHHVNSAKNDFYNWVYHAVKDEKLALQLSRSRSRDSMAKAVNKRINELSQRVVVKKQTVRETTIKQLRKIAIPPAPDLSQFDTPLARPEPPAPVKSMPTTLEDIEAIVQRRLTQPAFNETISVETIRSTPVTIPKEISSTEWTENVNKDETPSTLSHHILPYGLGLMAGILAGLVIARFFI